MKKILISVGVASSLLSGCSTLDSWTSSMPDALSETSIVYRQDIQQGNVVTQEQLNQLQPGMAKHQVKYILGTPLLVDVFHADQWDYYYSMRKGAKTSEIKQITLMFRDERLTGVNGDMRPMAKQVVAVEKEAVHSVPDYVPEEESIWSSMMRRIGSTVGLSEKEQ